MLRKHQKTQEEVIGFQDLDDAFLLAEAAVDNLIKDLDTSETEV